MKMDALPSWEDGTEEEIVVKVHDEDTATLGLGPKGPTEDGWHVDLSYEMTIRLVEALLKAARKARS